MGNGKRQSVRLAAHPVSKQLTQHLPHASPPSSPLATIHDLPLETIERVVNTAYSVTRAGGSAFAVAARTTFLLATSLVCRAWTPVAQRELYRNVCIGSKSSSYDSFVAAGPGRYTVETLVLNASGVSADVVSFVLSNVRGVTNLTLVYGQVGADCLNGDNLKDLKRLELCRTDVLPSFVVPALSFHLTTLKLTYVEDPSSFQLLDALSHQSSIVSLDVEIHPPMHDTEYPGSLERVAALVPQLQTLEIRHLPSWDAACIGDLIRDCTQLEHLTTDWPLVATLSDQPPASLVSWTVGGIGWNFDPEHFLDQVLGSNPFAAAIPKQLILQLHHDEDPETMRQAVRWQELEQLCYDEGVELVVLDCRSIIP